MTWTHIHDAALVGLGFGDGLGLEVLGVLRVLQPKRDIPGMRELSSAPVTDDVLLDAKRISQLSDAALGLNCGF